MSYKRTTAPKALSAIILITSFLAATTTSRVLADKQECIRDTLEPLKLRSAIWNNVDRSFYLIDEIGKSVRKISLASDGSISVDLNPKNIDLEPNITAKRSDGGYLQLVTRGAPRTMHWLDTSLKRRGSTELALPTRSDSSEAKSEAWENRVLAIYSSNWIPVGDLIFAYGFLGNPRSPNGGTTSFFLHQVRSPGSHNVIPKADMVMEFPHFKYYLLNTYMTAIGDTVYFMTMHNFPDLYAFDVRNPHGGATRLSVDDIAPFNRPIPPVDNMEMVRQIDNEAIPAGIYSDGGSFLYVLYRQPVNRGKAIDWKLYKLAPDPVRGLARSLGAVTLPIQSKARHVRLLHLPEESTWTAFEIGASAPETLEKFGDLESMVRIPQRWLDPENKTSPLLAAGIRPDVCRLND